MINVLLCHAKIAGARAIALASRRNGRGTHDLPPFKIGDLLVIEIDHQLGRTAHFIALPEGIGAGVGATATGCGVEQLLRAKAARVQAKNGEEMRRWRSIM